MRLSASLLHILRMSLVPYLVMDGRKLIRIQLGKVSIQVLIWQIAACKDTRYLPSLLIRQLRELSLAHEYLNVIKEALKSFSRRGPRDEPFATQAHGHAIGLFGCDFGVVVDRLLPRETA